MKHTCDGCDKKRSDVRSIGRDSNGDPDAPDMCFICRQEGKRGRVWNQTIQGYVPDNVGPEDIVNKEGMTFQEWLHAAFLGSKHDGVGMYARLHTSEQLSLQEAWGRGEDPTDHASARKVRR